METFKLTLPQEAVGRLLQLLSDHPYKQVADIMESIKVQVSSQVQEQRAGLVGRQNTETPAQPNGADH